MTIGSISNLFLVSFNKHIASVEQGLEIGGCTLRETREGLSTWPRAHPHSGSALKKTYTKFNRGCFGIWSLKRRIQCNALLE